MDLQERLSYLENVRDWQGLVEELEKGISTGGASEQRAAYHLRLGQILESKFLSGVKALKHFQDAYKLNPQLAESLEAARSVYWDLAKLNMVQKLVELELKSPRDGARTSDLLLELGDILCDAADYDKATATYAKALAASGGQNIEARGCLEDVQAESGSWVTHVEQLVRSAESATDNVARARLFLRATRILRRFAPDDCEAMLTRAYEADPFSKQIAALYEGMMIEAGRPDDLAAVQSRVVASRDTKRERGAIAHVFGARWVSRHQNVDIGARFLEEAVKLDPENEGAFQFLRDTYGRKAGDWDRVLTLAEEAVSGAENGGASFLLAQAGTIAWKQVGNLIKARTVFERLSAIAPEHPQIRAFEAQIGEAISSRPSAANTAPPPSAAAEAAPETPRGTTPPEASAESHVASASVPPQAVSEHPAQAGAASVAPAAAVPSAPPPAGPASVAPPPASIAPAPVSVAPPPASIAPAPASIAPAASVAPPAASMAPAADSGEVDHAKIAELRQLADKQETAKRYNEYVKTLLALAQAVPDATEKVALYIKAAELYVGKFANQAEAVKAYEAVIAHEPDNAQAIEYLRQMYEKRRDWEKLLGLERREAEALPMGSARAHKFLEIAKLATERVKKPDVCIELWNEVLASDDSNADALGALSQLFERSKEFDKLAGVLEKQAEITYDTPAKIQILTKLGTIYGDRLNNDEGAVTAWRSLLTLDPNDRKAQEALKKKYLTLGRWDDLEVFYAESGKWDEFIRVLEQQEAKETVTESKVSLLFKIAELWADKKQKSDRAAKAYEKVLELEAQNLRAAEALIPIYTAAGNGKALANAIEVKLGHEQDDVAKVALLREVAALYEGKVKEPQKAFDRYLSAFELFPSDEQSAEDVERAAKATAGWERLVLGYNQAIESQVDATVTTMLRLRLGRILVDELTRIDEALAVYRAVYEADSENEGALAALERLYRQTSRFEDLLGIYEKKRDLSVDPDEKRKISYEVAKLYETELGNVDKAIETYSAVLEDEPQDATALGALDRLYAQLQRWEPYADALRRRIELDVGEAELIDLKFRLGRTLEEHLGDAAGALSNYREILFLDAGHEGARLALEALLQNEELRAEAAGILESIYEERGDSEKLLGVLVILADAEAAPERRVQLLRKSSRVASDAVGDQARAFSFLARALSEDPQNEGTRAEIERVAEASTAWKELAALYEQIAQASSDATLAREYWMWHSAVFDARLGAVDEAARGYYQVLALDAGDPEALAALEQLFVRTERWTDLIGVFDRRVEQTHDPDAREALYVQMAEVHDTRLGNPGDAVVCYRKVLELDPASVRALTALDALFVRQKMWNELCDNLEAQLNLASTDEAQIGLMLRLAALRESEMEQVEVAVETYRAVLERDMSNQSALAALERLGQDPRYELVIADLVEPLYRHLGDFQKLIGAHEVQVRRSDDSSRRVELLHQISQLHEDAGGDSNAAFATMARALREEPTNEQTQLQLDRLARTTGHFAQMCEVYDDLAAKAQEPAVASALLMISARVYQDDLAALDTAIGHYQRVLEIDPTHLTAAESLERLFRQTERYGELSLILQRKSEIVDEPEDKKQALFQAASIEEDVLDKPDAAIAVYRRVLEIDEDDVRALDALIKQFLNLSRWTDLLAVYAKKADLVADPDEKKRIYYQVGAVYERELSDVPQAIDTYQKILELDPDDLQALSRLDVLYEQSQNWTELMSVLTRESEMTGDAQEAISFQYRIAELYEKRLDDVARAIELYREILGQQPDHEPTLAALEGLKRGDRDPLGAAAVLEPVYEASSAFPLLISVHEVQVAHSTDPFQKVDLLHRIARLYEDALDNHASAFDTYARAVVFDSANELTMQNVERLAMVVGRWPEVAKLYDAELDKLADTPDRLVELGSRVAQIYEVQLEDVESAIARYVRVTEVDPENQNAVSSLDRLYTFTERWTDLAVILAKEAEIGQTPDDILGFKFRLGQVYEKRLSDLDRAIAAYRDVIAAAPEHTETVQALEALFASGVKQMEIADILEPLYRQATEWEKLVAVYEAQLAHTPKEAPEEGGLGGQDDRLAAYYRIAELFEDKIVDPVQTLNTYVRTLKEYPLDEKASEEAPRLASGVDGGWEILANAYADIVGLHEDPIVQASVGKRLARTFEEELGDVERAEETYKYVLTVDPRDTQALENLDRIYVSLESWANLAQILEMRVKAPAEETELVDLYARLGEVYETRLVDIPNATAAYRKIFDGLDRTHEGAIASLARIYEAGGEWVRLNEVFERELENASGDVAEAEIRAKLAHLASAQLGDRARAIDTWKVVLDLRGEDPEALQALSDLYEAEQAWRELVDVLERQFDIADSDDDRVNILTRRARVYTDKMGRDDLALENWQRVLEIDFGNLAALRSVVAIRRRQQDPAELVLALHQVVDRAAALLDGDELKETFRELGRTYGKDLGQLYDAADAWQKLLEVGPDFEAMDELETIYKGDERWPDVIDVKMQRAAALEDPEAKIAELRTAAQLWYEPVQEPDRATPAWQKVLEVDPTHTEAFKELEKLHSAGSRWEPLIELYLARLETREEVADKTDLLRRIARVFEEKLDDKSQALDALINALAEDFHDRETAKYLERMAQATGRWGEVIQTANNWLQEQTESAQKIRLCLHLAKWYGDDLGHPEYAQPYYAQIVQLDPNNVGALRQMGQLYRKNANWQQLGATLTRALDVAVSDVDRKEILTELGELLDSQMSQQDQAVTYFNRALEVDGNFLPALENLERIYGARGQNKDLVDVLSRKVPALSSAEEVATTKLRIGGLHETMGDPSKAATMYREVVDAEPSNLQGLRGLSRVYEALQQWTDLVRVLEGELEVVTTERERIDVLLHLATIQEEQFLKPEIAAQCLERVVEIDPNHEQAYVALERNYRKLRQWLELINAYERHISATLERKTKVELYGAIAQVYADEVEDVERAIDAYRNIVDLEETNIAALDALAKLYDKQDDTTQAIDYMTRVADLTEDPKRRVEAFHRIGKALDEKLGDRVSAQDKYEMALDLDPSHIPSITALRQIAMDNADYDKAARYIDQEQSYTPAPRQRARLLVELGRVREELLGDHDSAVLAWEAAHEADPENEESALPLADEFVSKEAWDRAEPLLDLLVRKAGKRERHEQHELHKKLGRVASMLNKDDKAFNAYSAAHQLDLTDQETIRGLAEVCFRLKDWAGALTNFQKVLTALGDDETEARADVYYKLGCIKREQGQVKQAINNFEKALGVDSAHRPTLEALVSIYAELRDWKQVVGYKRQILDNVMDGEERFKLLLEIGDIWNDNDKNPGKAIEALEEARDLQTDNRPLLHKMLTLYEATSNWMKMVDTIQTIAEMEKDSVRKSKFIFTMAQIFRDKEGDPDRAVELFNDALDLNPGYLEAFERINKILTTAKDWKALERAYRKMLRRLSSANAGNPDLEYNLWHQLGIIYRDRLQETDNAIESFKMATRYKPDEPLERQILAELYELTEQNEAAIGEHSIVLQKDPLRVEPYRALYKLALKLHDYDRAWCMASALVFLQRADEEERRLFEDYRPKGMIQVKSRLDNEQWIKNLFHRDENIFIGKIFEMVTPAAVTAKLQALQTAKQLPVMDRRFKQDPATSTVTFAKTFGWAGQVLGVQLPELYVRNDVPGSLVAVPARPPASVAGQTVLTGFAPQELTFIVGKHLSTYRGEHYIKNIFPTLGELKVVLFSAIKLIIADFQVPPEMAQAVNQTAQQIARFIQPVERDSLRLVVQKFVEEGAKADLKRWMQATDITAARAGLLLCADLEIAKKIIGAEPQLPGDLPPADKMKELLIFSVSDQYLQLRKALGIAIG